MMIRASLLLSLMSSASMASLYPVGISNCGISSWIDKAPERAISMNQGTTEILLALGLADRTIGTAYLDDAIWGKLAEAYASIPVLSDGYPTAEQIRELQPDFLYASYSSAFATSHVNYTEHFEEFDECALVIQRSNGDNRTHCRQELHDKAGIQTYLQEPFCEKTELRPEAVTLEVLTNEIWEIATIFGVLDRARILIDSIEKHFEQAVSVRRESSKPIRVLWLDSVNKDGDPFIGSCCGAPQIILEHAAAENVFAETGKEDRKSWETVTWEEVAAADPDLIVVVDAAWDSIAEKLYNLCSNDLTREMRAVKNRSFLTVPFSGSTLGVRIGALAYNLAEAMSALVDGAPLPSVEFSEVVSVSGEGSQVVTKSGVKAFTALPVYEDTDLNDVCPGEQPTLTIADDAEDNKITLSASRLTIGLGAAVFIVSMFVLVLVSREREGKPIFLPSSENIA